MSMEEPRKRELVRLWSAAVLGAVLLAFVVDNRRSVRVGFVVTDRRVPLIAVLLITAALGAVIDRLIRWRHRRKAPDDQ